MKKRLLAGIMSLCMVFSLLPVSALAVDNSASGGKVETATATAQDDLVTFTKTVSKVDGTANTFQVELKAETKDTVTPIPAETSDIVLVIDGSGSMGDDGRLQGAKDAANAFTDIVLAEEYQGINKVAVISFGEGQNIDQSLTNVAQNVKDAVNDISAGGGTNTQGAIHAAREVLADSEADHKVIVLLSDGEPQNSCRPLGTSSEIYTKCTGDEWSHVWWEDHVGNFNVSKESITITGFDYNDVVGNGLDYNIGSDGTRAKITVTCEHGYTTTMWQNYFTNNGQPAILEADWAKNDDGCEIYSIYLGENDNENATETMSAIASDGRYYNVAQASDLADLFKNLAGEITTPTEAGTVEDPMGDYVQLVDNSFSNADSVTLYADGTEGFSWDWSKVDPTPNDDGTKTYTLTYQVTLDVDAAGFASDTPYHTNGDTVLTYYVGDEEKTLTIKGENTPTVSSLAAYTVTYDANGGTGTVPTDSSSPYEDGSPVTVLGNTGDLDKDEAVFLGWSTTKSELVTTEEAEDALNILGAGGSFEIDEDTILYAVWAQDVGENGIPDYNETIDPAPTQITVTYKIVGGTWSDGTTADKTVPLTLEEGSATLGDTIPTDMKPALGYLDEGAWDGEITGDTTVSENTTYTYRFDEDPVWHTEYDSIRVFLDDATQADFDQLEGGGSQQVRIYSDKYPVIGYGNGVWDERLECWYVGNVVRDMTALDIEKIELVRDKLQSGPSSKIEIPITGDTTYQVTVSKGTDAGVNYLRIDISKKDADPVMDTAYNTIRVYLDEGTQADFDALEGYNKDLRIYSDLYSDEVSDGKGYYRTCTDDYLGFYWTTNRELNVTGNDIQGFALVKDRTFAPSSSIYIPAEGNEEYDVKFSVEEWGLGSKALRVDITKKVDPNAVFVTYEIVGGTWGNETSDSITVELTKDQDGMAALGSTIPTGMTASEGYLQDSGKWNVDIDANTTISENTTYTYIFSEDPDYEIWDRVYPRIYVYLDEGTTDDLYGLDAELSHQVRIYSDKYLTDGFRACAPTMDNGSDWLPPYEHSDWWTSNGGREQVTASDITTIGLAGDMVNGSSNLIQIPIKGDNTYTVEVKVEQRLLQDCLCIYITKNPIEEPDTYSVTYEWDNSVYVPVDAAVPTDSTEYESGDSVKVDTTYKVDDEIVEGNYKYIFEGWTVTRPTGVTIANGAFVMPDDDVTITGKWERVSLNHSIYVTVTNGTAVYGDFSTNGSSNFTVVEGQSYTITFTPTSGYALDEVKVDDVVVTAETDQNLVVKGDGSVQYTFSNVTEDRHIEVSFQEAQQGPDSKPEDSEIPGILGADDAILVDCVSKDVDHGNFNDKTYDLWPDTDGKNRYEVGEVEQNGGVYTCTVTILPGVYVDQYSTDTKTTHWLDPDNQTGVEITLTWDAENQEWTAPAKEDGEPWATFTVACVPEKPGDGEIPGIVDPAPGDDEVNALIQVNCVYVDAVHGLQTKDYELWANNANGDGITRYTVDGPEWDEASNTWTCTVTFVGKTYADRYNEEEDLNGAVHGLVPGQNPQTVVLTWNAETQKWTAPTALTNPIATFQVTCDPTVVGSFELTYNANGGKFYPNGDTSGQDTYSVKKAAGTYTLAEELPEEVIGPIYNQTEATGKVLFAGWTTEKPSEEVYRYNDADIPEIVETVTIEDQPVTVWAVWGYDEDEDGVADINEVVITPADITIYTGGDGYGGVTNADGDIITNANNSGLPEPGYHIDLPANIQTWLGNGTTAENLATILRFEYNVEEGTAAGTRNWEMKYAGVYATDASGNPLRYVYTLEPSQSESGEIPVRILYKDGNTIVENDQIDMSATAAHEEYTMTINPGELDQNKIQAKLTKDGVSKTLNVFIGTGKLTIRSVVEKEDNTSVIAANESSVTGNEIAAVGNNASYVVNDSEVSIDVTNNEDRVQLLVDKVSDSEEFDEAMEDASLTHAKMSDGACETAYLDLVDTENGNTVVTLSRGSMDIYWPMPENANAEGTFKVVHYVGMDRESTVDTGDLPTLDSVRVLQGDKQVSVVTTGGQQYIKFSTDSFSPFALVYETKDPGTGPDTDPDDDKDDDDHYTGGGGNDNDSDPTGNLSIELDVNGGDDSFTFTVYLTDKDGDDLRNNFYYNGDYTGTIGSGDEITLEGGDKIVIRNLPEGTRYEVVIETADGYTYVIDGEEGIIHTGTNEAEFTATRTVPVADPTVTGVSRWLNITDHIAYLTGYPTGGFGPDNSMTRAEVAQMFYALLNNKNVTITKTFPDVPSGAWYATAVNTLASLGMVSGDENGNYRPDAPITRAEFCAIALAFAYEPENAVCYFTDVARGDWFYPYVAQAASYGWIGGYTDGSFGPNQQITRAQVTTIVNNMLGRVADRDYVIDHQNTLVQFNDLTRAHWAYFQIMEATNAHDYTKSNGTENWR